MTEDVKATRLSKAAREFNVGISTIVEFLHKKGFVLDPNPNTKLPHEAYLLLVKEYSTDISAKKESEKLILRDLHRKKESVSIDDVSVKSRPEEPDKEDEILIKESSGLKKTVEIKPDVKKPDIKLVGKIDLEKPAKPKTEKPVAPKEVPDKKHLKKEPGPEKVPVADEDEKSKAPIDIHIVGKIDLEPVTKEVKPPAKEKPGEKEKPGQGYKSS
jgi:translation initiation factor IF-2